MSSGGPSRPSATTPGTSPPRTSASTPGPRRSPPATSTSARPVRTTGGPTATWRRSGSAPTSATAQPIFVGIARDTDVERWLTGVPHDEIVAVDYDPFHATYRVHDRGGTATASSPLGERFWVRRTSGLGTRTLTWHLRSGHWAVVMMNADGSAPVRADVDLGVKVRYLVPLAIGLGGGGIVLLLIGAGLIVGGVVARGRESAGADGAPVPSTVDGTDAAHGAEPVH